MKSISIVLFVNFLLASLLLNAQALKIIKEPKPQKEKSFFEIQKEFNNYWAPYHVTDGYYTENGIKKKASGWKQFKRWEYYWENRVNPVTGAFPKTTAADIYMQVKNQRNSRSSGGNWISLGPNSSPGGYQGLGRINCVDFRPGDNNTYYVGAPSGGLWKTTDNATTWSVLTDDNAVLGVSDVIVIAGNTTATDTVYIATGDRDGGSMWNLGGGSWNDNNSIGVLKSTDGGTTWAATGLSFSASEKKRISRLLMNPDDHNILYAATSNGVYRTTDAGVNWTLLTGIDFVDLEFKPRVPQTIYGGTRTGHIYRSTNGGTNWSDIVNKYSAGGRRVNLAVSAADSTIVYAVMSNNQGGLYGVYRSNNSGASFSLIYNGSSTNHNLLGRSTNGSSSGGQGSYDLSIAVSPVDAGTVYVGGINSQKSTDSAKSWNAVNCWTSSYSYNKNGAPVVHADKHMMKFRSSDTAFFETNDGGVYYTKNGGTSWTDATNGIVPSQLYRLGVSANSSSEIIIGLQDNGTKKHLGGTWSSALKGDGMECAIDPTNDKTQYGETQNGHIKKTTNRWSTYTNISSSIGESGSWVTPFVIDPNVHTTLYAGMNNVWKTTNQGTSWTKITSVSVISKYRSIAVAPSNSQVIYIADNDSIWVTTNGGSSWSYIKGSLPTNSSSITYISVKNDDPATAWVSMGQYNSYGVFETTDYGASWTNISTGLPNIPVMCVIQNKLNTAQTELYAATDVGVYVKLGSTNWAAFSTGLPNVVVNELEIYYNSHQPSLSKLRAATSGRGIWETDLYSPPNVPPIADFEADITSAGVDQTVSFTDLSANTPTSWNWSFTPGTISFVDGTNANSQNPKVSFDEQGNYTVQLIATNANGSDTAIKTDYIDVSLLINYCSASGGGESYITDVKLGTINNTGTGDDGYTNYTNLSTQLTIASSNTINLHFPTYFSGDSVGGWIDWNHDGDFDDANEKVFSALVNGFYKSATISVPYDAHLDFTTMRIREQHFGELEPCGTSSYGEVEDYSIDVLPATTTWIGNSTQWNDAANWSTGVIPTASYNVTIPASPTGGNFPEIPAGYTAKCNKLTLETNAGININGSLEVNQ